MERIIASYLGVYRSRLKASSFSDYASILRHHLAHFSTLEELNFGLEGYLSGLKVSGKRRNNILAAARSLLAWSLRRGLWSGPIMYIPAFPGRPKKVLPLNPEEARLIMEFSPQPYKDYFQFALASGLRVGELLALRFEDFDLAGGVLKVRRSISAGEVGTTKTVSSDRSVPLFRPLREVYLRRLRGNERDSPWFCYSSNRGTWSHKTLSRIWKGLLEAFGIEHRRLYATRHTFASLAIAAGEDPLWIAEIMGHSRPDQLLLKYATYLKGVKPDGSKLMGMLIGSETLMQLVKADLPE